MIVALYTRVSTEDQAENGTSLDAQKRRLQDYASSHNYSIYKIYSDEGISGASIEKRTALKELLADSSQKKFNAVLVCKIDRLSRKLLDLLTIKNEFDKNKIELIVADESVNPNDDSGNMMLSILGAVSEFEKSRITARMISGKRELAEKGIKLRHGGYLPFGYNYDETTKCFIPNEYAPIVKTIYAMYLNGKSYRKINKYLINELHLEVATNIAQKVIRNPLYKGYVAVAYYRQNVVKNNKTISKNPSVVRKATNIIPIIDEDTWNKANDIASRNIKQPKKNTNDEYYLIDVLYCSTCGYKLGTRMLSHDNKEWKYYCCKSKNLNIRLDSRCPKTYSVPIDDLHAQFLTFIKSLNTSNVVNRKREYAQNSSIKNDLSNIMKTIDKKRQQKIILLDKLSSELITDDDYIIMSNKLTNDITLLQKEYDDLFMQIKTDDDIQTYQEALYNSIKQMKSLAKLWNSIPDVEKRYIVDSCIKRIEIKDKKIVKIELK